MTAFLSQPLELPCGAILPNRLAKAAMSEGMADADNHATTRLNALYGRWAHAGAGLLLSGNIQVDRWHLERPGNIVLDDERGLTVLGELARIGKSGGAHFWAQLSHTGRQVDGAINPEPLAPSRVEIDMVRGAGFSFAPPRAMTEADIERAIAQFGYSAALARAAGFTGVELHAAHGYLLSQFLSPLANRREDCWGGSLENRARLLLAAIASVRAAVGPDFPIGIKLNASDFQKGGFTSAECLRLVQWLNDSTLDLLELSGGSLEQPKVVGVAVKDEGEDGRRESTIKREAYFVAFAGAVRQVAKMPVMVTGGFRTASLMSDALEAGELDVVGLGRPMIVDPRAPARLLSGEIEKAQAPGAPLELFHILGWHNMQLERMADGLDPDLSLAGAEATAQFTIIEEKIMAALVDRRSRLAA
jgi:2,4-dienoyl-CoA reductase-like NADH-dependent reductase (Old Yellow Enzyme family)